MVILLRYFKSKVALDSTDDVTLFDLCANFHGRSDFAKVSVNRVHTSVVFDDDDFVDIV